MNLKISQTFSQTDNNQPDFSDATQKNCQPGDGKKKNRI